jgi:hypothetical protein
VLLGSVCYQLELEVDGVLEEGICLVAIQFGGGVAGRIDLEGWKRN